MADPFLCPGCGKDVTGFVKYEAHYADADDLRVKKSPDAPPWPWTGLQSTGTALGTVCEWTRDYLSAEWLRLNPQPWSYT